MSLLRERSCGSSANARHLYQPAGGGSGGSNLSGAGDDDSPRVLRRPACRRSRPHGRRASTHGGMGLSIRSHAEDPYIRFVPVRTAAQIAGRTRPSDEGSTVRLNGSAANRNSHPLRYSARHRITRSRRHGIPRWWRALRRPSARRPPLVTSSSRSDTLTSFAGRQVNPRAWP